MKVNRAVIIGEVTIAYRPVLLSSLIFFILYILFSILPCLKSIGNIEVSQGQEIQLSVLIIGGSGYIGTALAQSLENHGYSVETLDLLPSPLSNFPHYQMDYRELDPDKLSKFSVVIMVAGVANVKAAARDEEETILQNTTGLFELATKLKRDQTLIYASSGAIYSGMCDFPSEDERISGTGLNVYDRSKYAADSLMTLASCTTFGLRFGTVSGPSPKIRWELAVNSMTRSAVTEGVVYVSNGDAIRPFLGINDLCAAIEAIIVQKKQGHFLYNLASFTTTMADLGNSIARYFSAAVKVLKPTPTYSFNMSTEKFEHDFYFTFQDSLDVIVTQLEKKLLSGEDFTRSNELHYSQCLACGSGDLKTYLNLNSQPLANDFLDTPNSNDLYPLGLKVCLSCYHSQLESFVKPDILFDNYLYVSGTTATLAKAFDELATYIEATFGRNSKVLDIASNDGTFLKALESHNLRAIGVDPAFNLIQDCRSQGLDVFYGYWNLNLARRIKRQRGEIQVITALNVLAHTPDPSNFLMACREILSSDGQVMIQTSQTDMVPKMQFDTVYHEHYSYFTVNSMITLANRCGFDLVDISEVSVHGGSRLWTLQPKGNFKSSDENTKSRISAALSADTSNGLYNTVAYESYDTNVKMMISKIKRRMGDSRRMGRTIIGYGAAAKSTVLINSGSLDLTYVVDENPLKQNKYVPGTSIPVLSPARLIHEDNPITIIIFAWNFANEIINKIKALNLQIEVEVLLPFTDQKLILPTSNMNHNEVNGSKVQHYSVI